MHDSTPLLEGVKYPGLKVVSIVVHVAMRREGYPLPPGTSLLARTWEEVEHIFRLVGHDAPLYLMGRIHFGYRQTSYSVHSGTDLFRIGSIVVQWRVMTPTELLTETE